MQNTARTIEEWTEQIRKDVAEHPVFIVAKGEKNAAMCGFSHHVMQVFNQLRTPYEVLNIFRDPNIRPAACSVANWPTTPQVYVMGEFVGGCVIVMEMFQSGELPALLDKHGIEHA